MPREETSDGGTNRVLNRDNAFMQMTSPLGPDVMVPTSLQGAEAISQPYDFTVEVVSQQAIEADSLLDKPVCVTLHRPDHDVRYFNGIVRKFTWAGPASRDLTRYVLQLVPQIWFLGQMRNSRLFQNQSSKDILSTIFGETGVTGFRFSLTGTPAVREYTTQYDETTLAFVSRLMQQEGWFYFFEHAASSHTLVIADSNAAFRSLAHPDVKFVPEGGQSVDCLTSWRPATATASGKISAADYNSENPSQSLLKSTETTLKAASAATRTVYEFPALTRSAADVPLITRRRMEAAEVEASIAEGVAYQEAFTPGSKFHLSNDPVSRNDYVLHSVFHTASDDTWRTGSGATDYSNRFTAFAASLPWRDRLTVPRPRMDGFYSAIVMGPAGEEIHADALARILVQFNWAAQSGSPAPTVPSAYYPPGSADVSSRTGTAWVRVMQPWAGNGWGWQHLPRIGSEVAVAFMNGDPDWPVVVGGLYNGSSAPIFALPDQKTKTGLRTRSSMGGGSANFSEFSIDDKTGSELMFLHAEKNYTLEVENDSSIAIQHDQTIKISNDQKLTVGNNQTIEIDAKQSTKIASGRTVTVTSGGDSLEVKDGNLAMKATAASITGEAATSIELKVGSNSITISQSGIQIKGMSISISGDMQVELKGGLQASVSGGAELQLKGAIVMIN